MTRRIQETWEHINKTGIHDSIIPTNAHKQVFCQPVSQTVTPRQWPPQNSTSPPQAQVARKEGRTKRAALPYTPLYIVWPKILCVAEEPRRVFPSILLCCLFAGISIHVQFSALPNPSPISGNGVSRLSCFFWGRCSPLPDDLARPPAITS